MKSCVDCGNVYPDREECCPKCGCDEYNQLTFPFYDDLERYIEPDKEVSDANSIND